MKLLDTNILLYSLGREHAFREPCHEIIAAVQNGDIQATIDTETLQEVLEVYRNRGEHKRALEVFERMSKIFSNAFSINLNIMVHASHVLHRYPGIDTRDGVHAGVVLALNLEGIVSTDKHFDKVKEIRRFDPRELIK